METDTTEIQANATESTESTEAGQAQASETETGQSAEKASDKEGTAGEGLFDGMTPEKLHKSYKNLQREYSRIQNDVVKKFEVYGGPEQVLQWTQYLANNPEFNQWVVSQKNKTELGIDESTLDESTKSALQTVRKIARSVAEEEMKKVRQEIEPISETQKQEVLARHFEDMDDKYGDSWHEMRDLMSELSESLPQNVQDRPKFDDVEDLYFKALRKSGQMDSYAAKQYEKKITEKRAKSTSKPTSPGESTPSKARSIAEAFAMAKQVS